MFAPVAMGITGRTLATSAVSAALLAALLGVYWRLTAAEDENRYPALAGPIAPLSPAAATISTDAVVPVEGVPVVRDAFVLYVDAAGEAQAARSAALLSDVAGPVREVRVREGATVRAHQLLVRVDPARYELVVRQAEAALTKAQARFAEHLLFLGEIADADVRAERERMARVHSGLVEVEIALQQAQLDLERASIRSPFDGRVANLAAVPGQRVAVGDTICVVVDLARIRVEVQALEGQVIQLAPGRETHVVFSALPDTAYVGRIATINPVIDPKTRAARVTVTVENADDRIRPGMYARVRIAARLYSDRVMVPREGVLERDRRKVVFVFEPEAAQSDLGRAKWTYVKTGLENEDLVEIVPSRETSMLEPGQVVLVEGHTTLIHDAKVRLVNH